MVDASLAQQLSAQTPRNAGKTATPRDRQAAMAPWAATTTTPPQQQQQQQQASEGNAR
jgi:hypothetical protein